MKLTPALKAWLQEHQGVAADASDDAFKSAAAEAILAGNLTPELQVELCKDEAVEEAKAFTDKLDALFDLVKANADEIKSMKAAPAEAKPALKASVAEVPDVAGMASAKGSDGVSVNVISAHKQYDSTRNELRVPSHNAKGHANPNAGQRLKEAGRTIDRSSELDQAINGAWFKLMISGEKNLPYALRMTDHDKDLVRYALENCKFGGVIRGEGSEDGGAIGVDNRKLTEWEQKALLDDGGASGGLEVAPIQFDDAVITIPLLYGELFPKVNVVNITRGRRIEGATITNPTLAWGTGDGTEISLLNTASFVTAFDTTIHPITGAIEIGLDLISDSPVNIGATVAESYGRQLQHQLDKAISMGTGSGQPTGILVGSGTTAVSSTNGTSGPPTVGDYEGLLFGVAKEYKQGFSNGDCVFCANETTYSRARGIAVGSSDQRRVFGMTHEDYMLLGRPFAIEQNTANTKAFFANLKRYRLYRRLGLTVRTSTEGKETIRKNQLLMVVRARYGGQLEDGGAAAVMTDCQS